MRVLGIETSCDETGVAIYDSHRGLLAHQLFSQKAHNIYGGVVPELASRDHVRKALPMIQSVLAEANLEATDIEGIGYTVGPGLIGALMVGAMLGHSLAFAWNIPSVGVHHLEGHLLAPMLEETAPLFPFIALLVSGGHTQLIHVEGIGRYTLLGESLDDAAGEAFDKTAKLLGLPYPGGPKLAEIAANGNRQAFLFPRPLLKEGLDFSFSGLKTAVAKTVAKTNLAVHLNDIAASFETAVVDTLITKSLRALKMTGLNQLVVAGGVGANLYLRETLRKAATEENVTVYYPRPQFCTDNGAMIAYAACQRLLAGQVDESLNLRARWPLSELKAI